MSKKDNLNDITINVRLPKELHEKLKYIAGTQLMPVSVAVRTALLKYAEDMSRHAFYADLNQQNQAQKPKSGTTLRGTQGMIPPYGASTDDDWV